MLNKVIIREEFDLGLSFASYADDAGSRNDLKVPMQGWTAGATLDDGTLYADPACAAY